MYFSKFPLLAYINSDNVNYSVATDITRRVAVTNSIKENFSLYDEYDVQEGDTPEILAYNLYKNSQYHWIILLLNDIIDPRFEWPLTQEQLQRYAIDKYGSTEAIYETHHYEASLTDTTIVDSDDANFPEKVEISNMDYEITLNETRRRIKILKPNYISSFITEFENKINV
jgi:hypothetical protein